MSFGIRRVLKPRRLFKSRLAICSGGTTSGLKSSIYHKTIDKDLVNPPNTHIAGFGTLNTHKNYFEASAAQKNGGRFISPSGREWPGAIFKTNVDKTEVRTGGLATAWGTIDKARTYFGGAANESFGFVCGGREFDGTTATPSNKISRYWFSTAITMQSWNVLTISGNPATSYATSKEIITVQAGIYNNLEFTSFKSQITGRGFTAIVGVDTNLINYRVCCNEKQAVLFGGSSLTTYFDNVRRTNISQRLSFSDYGTLSSGLGGSVAVSSQKIAMVLKGASGIFNNLNTIEYFLHKSLISSFSSGNFGLNKGVQGGYGAA